MMIYDAPGRAQHGLAIGRVDPFTHAQQIESQEQNKNQTYASSLPTVHGASLS